MSATLVRQRDGSADLYTPYSKAFVEDLKGKVPPHLRQWDPDDKCWILIGAGIPLAISVARLYYGSVDDIPANAPAENTVTALASPHAVLYLTPDAPDKLVTVAYKCLAKLNHPDRGGDTWEMQRINAAYETLRGKRGAA